MAGYLQAFYRPAPKPKKEVFVNELGNKITLQVTSKPIDGVQASTKKPIVGTPGILIVLEGPTSVSENHITRKEAEKLYEQLGRVLKAKA
jgi:hypothetical protein